VSNEPPTPLSPSPSPSPSPSSPPALAGRLGYLLKHAQQRLSELTAVALAPSGITGRQLAVLLAIDSEAPLSQQEAARRLGVDRTTMVALVDELEEKDLLQRRQDPADRRKNVVGLTAAGRTTLRTACQASETAEREFLAPLTGDQTDQVRDSLRALAFPAEG
jgi:DNA-binding MarR family transcriptional regulator